MKNEDHSNNNFNNKMLLIKHTTKIGIKEANYSRKMKNKHTLTTFYIP